MPVWKLLIRAVAIQIGKRSGTTNRTDKRAVDRVHAKKTVRFADDVVNIVRRRGIAECERKRTG